MRQGVTLEIRKNILNDKRINLLGRHRDQKCVSTNNKPSVYINQKKE